MSGPTDLVQCAEFEFQANPLKIHATVKVTPTGLMAIGALVSSILLSTCALVWVAGSVHRRSHLPFVTPR